eukprot:218474_1
MQSQQTIRVTNDISINNTEHKCNDDDDRKNSPKYQINVPTINIPQKQQDETVYLQPPHSNANTGSSTATLSYSSAQEPVNTPPPQTDSPSVIASSPSIIVSEQATPIIKNEESNKSKNPIKLNNESNSDKLLLLSQGLHNGYHELSVKIVKNDLLRQEVGIISNYNKNINIGNGGITENKAFGARAVCGNISQINSIYCAYYNANNKCECNKNILNGSNWIEGDEITIQLDLEKGFIQFMLNNENVMKRINVEKNNVYYAFVSYSGHCKFDVI